MKARTLNRRDTEIFSLSFLDCISCGFGAVILLLVLSKFGEPIVLEQSREDLEGRVIKLEREAADIRGETVVLNRDLKSRKEQLAEQRRLIARLQGDLSEIKGRYRASMKEADVVNKIEGRLVSAQQDLTEEMKRLLGRDFRRKADDAIGGIPVDSEYIIFIIDTSGSMFNYAWPLLLQKVEETLNIYPQVKGFQVMNDMGAYMFTGYTGKWIPDTPAQRKIVLDRLRNWNAFSNSSPVEGIEEAIRTYAASRKKISLYYFGDEFTGPSIDQVVRQVDAMNREHEDGHRLVRIHAMGFPVRPDAPQYTSIRFATLMRILCERNGGTFVGLEMPEGLARRTIRIGQVDTMPGTSAPALAATTEVAPGVR
jgi:hypothetical protein